MNLPDRIEHVEALALKRHALKTEKRGFDTARGQIFDAACLGVQRASFEQTGYYMSDDLMNTTARSICAENPEYAELLSKAEKLGDEISILDASLEKERNLVTFGLYHRFDEFEDRVSDGRIS